ncbi:MAG: tetratricopeptide repeat protein [Betaproteobacteria bacterium]|nr:tetratricopeptide repeat protein [Betaproteobacteria bacterium]
MNIARIVLLAIIFSVSFPSHGEGAQSSGVGQDKINAQILNDGTNLLKAKKPKEAIEYFEKIITNYEEKFRNDKTVIFSARSQAETLMYLTEAAVEKKDAMVVSTNWAYAYFMKAYALVELGKVSESKLALERALALSPWNSQFLSELGHIYQREKNWPIALQTFQRAEKAAKEFSPPESKNAELSRAWRGLGYAYVELGQLGEAEKMYRQCLELDKNDQRALNELRYVQNLRAKSSL